jgi:hypothetical protein
MSEAEKLATFLLALQTSPTQRKNFEDDPEGEMTRFNLDQATIDAVLAKDTGALWGILDVPEVRVHQIAKAVDVEKDDRPGKPG